MRVLEFLAEWTGLSFLAEWVAPALGLGIFIAWLYIVVLCIKASQQN